MTLPNVGDLNWGTALNNPLSVSLDIDGSIKDGAAVKSSLIQQIAALSQVAYGGLTSDSSALYIITS